jgi:hypothetical protein
MSKKKQHTRQKRKMATYQYLMSGMSGMPQRNTITQNSALLFANSPNRPYVPYTTFIASPYNNGVVPEEYKVISTRLETLEKMNQALQDDLKDNALNYKTFLNTQRALIQTQMREKEAEKLKEQQEKRANRAEEELEEVKNSRFYLDFGRGNKK